ncbi:uncharacterized protein Tco025E_05884 [Trypanosoma conorhini]|uniref:Uncharacterized protein n=1 Tax=Trypanosoma conorhini TaxID=83891 RepID=A0A3R7KT23_9TRYP|nr:uncharacterized protein Tco025E_05884 [Trypanosoma conorhini]RNF14789.1 hypothetical protein Tco025E_05884 [Trypanosoma conorhini]
MRRDTTPPRRKATLADIVAGRQCQNVSRLPTRAGRSQRTSSSTTSATVPSFYMSSEDSAKNDVVEEGARCDAALEVANSGRSKADNVHRGHLRCLFANENGVRRDNVIQLLKKLGIHSTPDDAALKLFFEANTNADSSILPDQWVALVEQLLHAQKDSGDGATQLTGSLLPKPSSAALREERVEWARDTVSAHGHSEARTEHRSETQARAEPNDQPLDSSKRGSAGTSNKRWATGSEVGDAALLKLFIHCGALNHKGRGLSLFVEDFKRMCVIRQNALPPKRLFCNATSKIGDCGSKDLCFSSPGRENVFITLPQFLGLLRDELRGITGGCRGRGRAARTTPPTVSMVLAAVAPMPLQQLFGSKVVDYLRQPSTVNKALAALEGSIEPLSNSDGNVSREAKAPGVTTTTFTRRASMNARHPQFGSGRFSTSTLTSRNNSCVTAGGASAGSEDPDDGEKPALFLHAGAARVRRGKSVTPRYMQQKPLDEISVSVIARSKARRLIDELRKKAIPINRYECFARIGCVQQALFEEAGLGSEDEDDETESVSSAASGAGAHRRHHAILYKAKPPDVAQPLLPGMYRMGGPGQPKPLQARQKTFERLHRQGLGQVSGFVNFAWRRSASASAMGDVGKCSLSERGAHASGRTTPIDVELSTAVGSRDDRAAHQADTLSSSYQTGVPGQTSRRDSRAHPMLADFFATRFPRYAIGPQRPSLSCGTGNRRGVTE